MNRITAHISKLFILAGFTFFGGTQEAHAHIFQDTTAKVDTPRFPIKDRMGDPYTFPNRNTFDLKDTAFVKRSIEYDPVTKEYYIVEKIGNKYYRTPTTFSFEEFMKLQGQLDEKNYFKERADFLSNLNRRLNQPKFKTQNSWFNRMMGVGPDGKVKVEIKPSGYVDILAGYMGQNIDNPTLPERARKVGGFDFNMNTQMNLNAKIGDKLNIPINYNTLANFNFENQLKLDYRGQADDIIKQVQAGTVNFTTKSTLIPGPQALFGLKTQLQFGKLFVTGVMANQRSNQQSLQTQGGSALQSFSLRAHEYDENRHFLLAQYFYNNYNSAMAQLPIVNSNIQILRVEVWVTNRNAASTTDVRDVVGFMDLGEANPFRPLPGGNGTVYPSNESNGLYGMLTANPNVRNSSQVTNLLGQAPFNLTPVQDFEKTFARKLNSSEYYFNPQIGFISLSQPLQPDEVLGIAFQYTYNGQIYQVGEFSQDVPPDATGTSQKVLFLKLLKATSQRPNLPLWNLMMKNVYSVGWGQLERQDFTLDVTYEEPSLGEKRYLPPSDLQAQYQGQPLIMQLNLDRLNNQNDPQPDGKFDFIEGFTVISSQSRIIFPVLEPFGRDLEYVYNTPAAASKYLFYPLYDTIKAIAETYANLNRFKLTGRSKSSGTAVGEYQLGFNIPRGSVTVTAGGQVLQENIDYEINYDLGSLRIVNPFILSSGVPVNINYENQATFGLQQKNFMGLRLDYLANKNLSIGGTIARLGERPFFIKQNYGEDPVRNTMFGIDVDYNNEWPRMTKWLNKLPFYSTKAMSSISMYAEGAMLKPGHPKQINAGTEDRSGQIYIDDFEGTRAAIDLRFPIVSWNLASIPQGQPSLIPNSNLTNDLRTGYDRAKLAWYMIEPVLQERRNSNNPLRNDLAELSKPETRQVYSQEIFPKRSLDFGQGLLTTFDLAFYPKEKGPYNFQSNSSAIDADGNLLNPKRSWGGLMRNIDQIDFETGNFEFIEFWVMDPFINNPTSSGGKLYFNLGNISEDVLKDGKRFYENGLPTPTNPAPVDENTVWGKVPANPMQITNAFSNKPEDRQYQDVGFDGLTDEEEKTKFQDYLNSLATTFGTSSAIYQKALNDPSGDNFKAYRDASFDQPMTGILGRYKNINNPHGNSPVNNNSDFVNAFTQTPDAEELNRDNTLNEVEEYFQYEVDIRPNMNIGSNFITDKRIVDYTPLDGSPTRQEAWYLFRIPIAEYNLKVGNIPDFKSIRFIRMFVNGFEDSVVMRFGKLELIRNQWRKYKYEIDTVGNYINLPANDPVSVNTLAVNLEENDTRYPVNYIMPPGIDRQQQLSNNNVQLFLNEQSLSLQVCDLNYQDARGVFKTMNMDMRQYGKLKMFIHAEKKGEPDDLLDYELNAIVRLGSDFSSNYYEIKIPLKTTRFGATNEYEIWPEENNLDISLLELTRLKSRRNQAGVSPSQYYSEVLPNGKTIAIFGNPNLGEVRGMMMAVQNNGPKKVCAEVWFNELRLSNLDEDGGWAALGRMDIKLADLGSITLAGTARSNGFGTLEQRVNERSREDMYTFDVSANIDAGKLLPKEVGVQVPVYAGVSKIVSTPEYDPYDLDIKLKDKLKAADASQKDSIRNDAQDITTVKTLNFTNVKKLPTEGSTPKIWSLSNIDLNYSFTETERQNPLIESDLIRRTRAAVGYNYAPRPKEVYPFRRAIKSTSKWFALIKDFNVNFAPSQLSFRADIFRQFGATRVRNIGGGPFKIPETYDKYFTFDRYYILKWNLTKSISLDYTATNFARIDEPNGRIDTDEKKEIVRQNLLKGGRNTQFAQDVTLNYQLPLQKLPILDWVTARVTYNAKYNWLAASLMARELGNILSNTQTKTLNGDLNFETLYNKSKLLRAANSNIPTIKQPRNNATDTSANKGAKPRNTNGQPQLSGGAKMGLQLLTALKRVNVQYSEDLGTTLPGYMDSTKIFGYNMKSHQPGFGFIFGYQPDTNWINRMGTNGLLSNSELVTAMIQQRYNQRLNITAQVVPIRDFVIDFNIEKTFSKNYSELYKDTTGNSGLARLNPYAMGSFSVSYISYKTMFGKFDPNVVSETFKTFESHRAVLAKRLSELNPYGAPADPSDPGYYEGYGRYAQDVVIPAFLAAYSGKDPSKISLTKNANPSLRSNPFAGIKPLPNWSVTYTGLSRIEALKSVFTNFTLRHGYHSTLSMNSFNTALLFVDPLRVGMPAFKDQNGNYVPYFLIPNITIQEAFDPLLDVDMTFTNQLQMGFGYRKSRQLSLSLIDYQLAENRSQEVSFNFNWRKKGMPWPKQIGKMKLDNDVTFRIDFSLRDDATANSKLDQGTSFGTGGQKVMRIAPSIDYVLNNRVSLRFYYEQTKNTPKISTAYPITNTRGGVQVRISLADL